MRAQNSSHKQEAESILGMACKSFETSKPKPSRFFFQKSHTFYFFPNSSTEREPSAQTHEPTWVILIQNTIGPRMHPEYIQKNSFPLWSMPMTSLIKAPMRKVKISPKWMTKRKKSLTAEFVLGSCFWGCVMWPVQCEHYKYDKIRLLLRFWRGQSVTPMGFGTFKSYCPL